MMVDTYKYDEFFYVHSDNEAPDSGDEYSSEDDAIAAAIENATNGYGDRFVVSHVMTRRLGTIKVSFERE